MKIMSIKIWPWKKKGEAKIENYNTIHIKSIRDMDEIDVSRLKKQYLEFSDFVTSSMEADRLRVEEETKVINGTCPHCKSVKVNNRMQIKNHVKNHGGYQREAEVFPINKCNDCEHEWKHQVCNFRGTGEYDVAERIIDYIRMYHNAVKNFKFDPFDFANSFTDPATALKAEIEHVNNGWYGSTVKQYMSGRSLELAKYIVEEKFGKFEQHDHDMENWNKYDKAPLLQLGLKMSM